jgi:hypothetical protein
MEPEGSLSHSQEPATCPYPEPDKSSSCLPHSTYSRSILTLSSHLRTQINVVFNNTEFGYKPVGYYR